MPLPVLGAAASLLVSSGARVAAKKYGPKAIEEAKKQIAKRKTAIDKSAKNANDEALGTTGRARSKAATEMRTANKGPSARRKTRLNKNNPKGFTGTESQLAAANKVSNLKKSMAGSAKKDTIPTMKKGGKVRGAGMAKKGVRACKMR